jgi:heme/copper-type cytochrome/quinol oxidase subunit 2
MWIGLFAAPIAWVGTHGLGWGVSEANCEPVDRQWGIAFHTWEWAMLAFAVVLTITGIVASVLTYLQVKGTDNDDAPPSGRIWMLSISGMVLSPLLLMLILLTHVGALLLSHCHQA